MRGTNETGGGIPFPSVLAVLPCPPSQASGAGIILNELIGHCPPGRVTVITDCAAVKSLGVATKPQNGANARFVCLPLVAATFRGVGRITHLLNFTWITLAVTYHALRFCREGVILASPSARGCGSAFYVAAYIAHRISRMPLLVYEMDEWRASLGDRKAIVERTLERMFHRRILTAASVIFVISAPLSEEFDHRFGVTSRVLAHSVDMARFRDCQRLRDREKRIDVVFTGAIYSAQADAIANVLRAVQSMQPRTAKLVLYSHQGKEELSALGISGCCLDVRGYVSPDEMPRVLSEADVLLLPYSFAESERAVVLTSYPTKTAEYLASGVPILVHAPTDASISRAARAGQWAVVVDEPTPDEIKRVLLQLHFDDILRSRLITAARRAAFVNHDPSVCRQVFQDGVMSCVEKSSAECR